MALILRLSAALDRRPEPAISSLKLTVKKTDFIVTLFPEKGQQNLALEIWSLKSCFSIVKESTGLDLKVLEGEIKSIS